MSTTDHLNAAPPSLQLAADNIHSFFEKLLKLELFCL